MFGTAPRSSTQASAKSALRIVHVLRAPVGGLFRHVCDLARLQSKAGHAVGIVCDANTGGAVAEEGLSALAASCSLGIHRIAMSRTPGLGDLAALAEIRAIVETMSPDVVHGHGAKGGAYARLLPRRESRTVLYTPHGGALHYSWYKPAGAFYLALERVLRGRADGIVFESEFSARAYARKIGKPRAMRVVANGLGEQDLAPLPEGTEYDAVFVGELRTLKGVDVLIEAVSRLVAARPFRVALAGSGPDEARFRAAVKEKGLEDSIVFLGHRPARDVFAMGRAVVVPSLAESFPYVVLEAVAAHRPVVATDVGGIPEIFGPHSGALVAPNDASALVKSLVSVLDNKALTRSRADALHARAAELFSAYRMAENVTRFYAECATSNDANRKAA